MILIVTEWTGTLLWLAVFGTILAVGFKHAI